MRPLTRIALLLGACLAVSAGEATTDPITGAPITGSSPLRPLNTICPVDGLPVDPGAPPVIVTDDLSPGDRTAVIGTCGDQECATRVRSAPRVYLPAARADRIADLQPPASVRRQEPPAKPLHELR